VSYALCGNVEITVDATLVAADCGGPRAIYS
jgi:hypothetical protein